MILVMSPTIQQTEVRLVFHGCRLGRSELNRLFNLAPEGIPAGYIAVSTQRDDTRYTADDLAALIDALHAANAPGDLHSWDNLMQVAGDAEGDRKISVDIERGRVVVQISGRDATWAYGQSARIQLLLAAAGGKHPAVKLSHRIDQLSGTTLLLLIAFFACLFAGIYVADPKSLFNLTVESDKVPQLLGALGGMAVWAVFAIIASAIVGRASMPLLLPTAEVPRGSWWNRASNADRIALVGLAVATLALMVAALTLGNELAGNGEAPSGKKFAAQHVHPHA